MMKTYTKEQREVSFNILAKSIEKLAVTLEKVVKELDQINYDLGRLKEKEHPTKK